MVGNEAVLYDANGWYLVPVSFEGVAGMPNTDGGMAEDIDDNRSVCSSGATASIGVAGLQADDPYSLAGKVVSASDAWVVSLASLAMLSPLRRHLSRVN